MTMITSYSEGEINMTMILNEVLGLLTDPNRVRIIQNGQQIFDGYQISIVGEIKEKKRFTGEEHVKRLQMKTELWHRNWKSLGLRAPIHPEEAPEYSFSDMEMRSYYEITLGEKKKS